MAEAIQAERDAPKKNGCRDPFFAVLFLANTSVLIWLAINEGKAMRIHPFMKGPFMKGNCF